MDKPKMNKKKTISPFDTFVEKIQWALFQYEREVLGERIKRGIEAKKQLVNS